ncbi:glycerol kinase GlpK [soil metagenome]
MHSAYILSIDQGTSSTKAIIFDGEGNLVCKASEPLPSYFPKSGYVEQDPEEIYQNVLVAVKNCLTEFKTKGGALADIQACGISNQRETFILWDEQGTPLYKAVSWQCKRSIEVCGRLKKEGLQEKIKAKTGLIIDPYFSGSKVIWLYENVESVRDAIDAGKAYFGTVDTWLLYKLTKGQKYSIDYTNASRTLFFNLHTLSWDQELLSIFRLLKLNLPKPVPSSFLFGESDFEGLLHQPIPISSMIGDSHAAAFGEGCFAPGTAKATMGTGCSILMNIGAETKDSAHGMVATVCWSTEDRVDYAMEGIIVSCGATIEYLKNELELFAESQDTEAMAMAVEDNGGVYIIPAFSGLGAPHWQMGRKASISGLTFASTKNHIVRAALESIPYQIKDVITAMEQDAGIQLQEIMVDGGMTSNRFVLQMLADLLAKPVVKKEMPDVSAKGAALLAGLQQKIFKNLDHIAQLITEKKWIEPSGETQVIKWHKEWQKIITGT